MGGITRQEVRADHGIADQSGRANRGIRSGQDTRPDQEDIRADGRSARWADHRATRREELVQVARKVVHHQGPDASMEEIAAAAGTSKSIVYRYFTDKAGLQTAVGQAVVEQMQLALEDAAEHAAGPRDSLRAMVEVYLEMIESSPNVYYFVTRPVTEAASVPLGHFLEAVADLVAAPFARAQHEDGATAQDGTAHAWAAGAVGFVRGAGEWWLSRRGAPDCPPRTAAAEQIAAWLWPGPGLLAAPPAPTSVDQPVDAARVTTQEPT